MDMKRRLFLAILLTQRRGAWAAGPVCEPFCHDTPCSGLNGNVQHECGTCPKSAACRPGAVSFGAALEAVPSPPEDEPDEPAQELNPILRGYDFDATHEKHVLYASEEGLSRLSFDCTPRGPVGEVVAPNGTRLDSFVNIPKTVAARMIRLCTTAFKSESIGAGDWELCVQPDPSGEKPKGVLNRTCALERHRLFWGDAYAPFERSEVAEAADGTTEPAGPSKAPMGHMQRFGEQGQRRVALPEVGGCLDASTFLAEYVDRHTPVVMRGCANTSNPKVLAEWSDAHLLATAPDHATERDSCGATQGSHAHSARTRHTATRVLPSPWRLHTPCARVCARVCVVQVQYAPAHLSRDVSRWRPSIPAMQQSTQRAPRRAAPSSILGRGRRRGRHHGRPRTRPPRRPSRARAV